MGAKLLTEIDPSSCQHRFTEWLYVPKKDLQPQAFETVSCWNTTKMRRKGDLKEREMVVWKRVCQICGHVEYQTGYRQLNHGEI